MCPATCNDAERMGHAQEAVPHSAWPGTQDRRAMGSMTSSAHRAQIAGGQEPQEIREQSWDKKRQ